MATPRVVPSPDMVRRHNELFDLYNSWLGGGDPDDDPEFVAEAREIMGLPSLDEASDEAEATPAEQQRALDDGERTPKKTMATAADPDDDFDEEEFEFDEAFDHPDEEQRARALARLAEVDGPDAVEAAAGKDITPGRDQLHHYWTRSAEGLARWVTSPHPWSTLVALLSKHVSPAKARVFASKWFKEVFGIWSGERKGKNPLGPG